MEGMLRFHAWVREDENNSTIRLEFSHDVVSFLNFNPYCDRDITFLRFLSTPLGRKSKFPMQVHATFPAFLIPYRRFEIRDVKNLIFKFLFLMQQHNLSLTENDFEGLLRGTEMKLHYAKIVANTRSNLIVKAYSWEKSNNSELKLTAPTFRLIPATSCIVLYSLLGAIEGNFVFFLTSQGALTIITIITTTHWRPFGDSEVGNCGNERKLNLIRIHLIPKDKENSKNKYEKKNVQVIYKKYLDVSLHEKRLIKIKGDIRWMLRVL
uniref:Uncharacterized protein n=1 Tax=Strigamia maritima TaxID=126957 RepID=T1J780_STRMM